MRATYLYRHFTAGGELLYVGITATPGVRTVGHSLAANWFDRVATIAIERFDSFDLAAAAEREAIQKEHPTCNIVHSGQHGAGHRYRAQKNMEVLRSLKDFFGCSNYAPLLVHFGLQARDLRLFFTGTRSIEGTELDRFHKERCM